MTDTYRLNEAIKMSGLKKKWIAEQLGLSYFGLQKKIDNENQFKAGEIKKLCELVGIASLKTRDEIFFAGRVDKMTTDE